MQGYDYHRKLTWKWWKKMSISMSEKRALKEKHFRLSFFTGFLCTKTYALRFSLSSS